MVSEIYHRGIVRLTSSICLIRPSTRFPERKSGSPPPPANNNKKEKNNKPKTFPPIHDL